MKAFFCLAGFCCCLLLPQLGQAIAAAKGVSLTARCSDGSTPLNSLAQRCQELPQLHWAGTQCDNATYSCPRSYDCTYDGLCCPETSESRRARWSSLCTLDPKESSALEIAGKCSRDSDCERHESEWHKCCKGQCRLIVRRCHYRLAEYLAIQSTGATPRQHLPLCDSSGGFRRVQEDPRFGIRWCVNVTTGLADSRNCCLPDARKSVCPDGFGQALACPRDMCSMEVCEAHPSAVCRVNACGSECRVEFVDSNGTVVNCSTGLSGCSAQRQAFYTELARLHRLDRTHVGQSDHFRDAQRNETSLTHLEECTKQTCVGYDAGLLDTASVSSSSSSSSSKCPEAENLYYSCPNQCQRRRKYNRGCNSTTSCCFTGCGYECVNVVPTFTGSEICTAQISSGHCPSTGCHRMCKRFGWDSNKATCRAFWYAGAGGNNNRFKTWSECMWQVQICHSRALLALPVKPQCQSSRPVKYSTRQYSTNGYFWCENAAGEPTSGSLYATNIICKSDATVLLDKYYYKYEQKYKITCPGGKEPQWCHNVQIDKSCQTPGVVTFADVCDDCRLVHVNQDGEEVTCHTQKEVCHSGVAACQSPIPRFTFNVAADTCQAAPSGDHQCNSSDMIHNYNSFSREDYCLHTCPKRWCPGNATTNFYPNLCVQPSCSVSGVVCIADECNGVERYIFLENGTEVTKCARKFSHFDLAVGTACDSSTTETTTTKSSSTTATSTTSTSAPKTSTSKTSAKTSTTSTTTPKTSTSASTTPTTTTAATTTTAKKAVVALCKLKSELFGVSSLRCSDNGQYNPKQRNSTHCFCVAVDSGEVLKDVAAVLLDACDSLSCPTVETLSVSLDVKYDADFNEVLPDEAAKAAMKDSVVDKFSSEAGLSASNVADVTLTAGSIIVGVNITKSFGDSVDLPAATFELRTMASKGSLTLEVNGRQLKPSASQNFNRRTSNSRVDSQTGDGTDSGDGVGNDEAGGVVGGVVATALVLAVAAVVVAFFLLRRRNRLERRSRYSEGPYDDAMSTVSSQAALEGLSNPVYVGRADFEDSEPYDNAVAHSGQASVA